MNKPDKFCECGHAELAHDPKEGCLADMLNCLHPEPCYCMNFTIEHAPGTPIPNSDNFSTKGGKSK